MTTGDAIFTVARRTVTAVQTKLRDVGAPVDRAAVYPATIPWDECDCGTLAVAVGQVHFTNAFPAVDDASQLTCGGGLLAVSYVVQLLRCVPQPSGTSLAPSVGDLEASARRLADDGWVVPSTVLCLLDALVDEGVIVQHVIRPLVFVGPEGACVGSTMTFVVAVPQSDDE